MKVGDKCLKCQKPVAALSEGYGLDNGECFHRDCFKCERCRIPITDGKFALDGALLYHPKCLSLVSGDVCKVCSKTIEDAVLTFRGTKYHSDCFTCASCANPLSGKPISEIEGALMCQTCATAHNLQKANIKTQEFNPSSTTTQSGAGAPASSATHPTSTAASSQPKSVASLASNAPAVEREVAGSEEEGPAVPCAKCKLPLGQESVMMNETTGYHPACFVCFKCGKEFPENKFTMHEGNLVHRECLTSMLAPTCSKCNEPITAGYIAYKNGKLHEKCFVCTSCQAPLSGKAMAEEDGKPFCGLCMEHKRKNAAPASSSDPDARCFICNKAVQDGLSLPLGRVLHRECFTCAVCGSQLKTTDKLAEKNNKYYHHNCYESINAERCGKCHKPLIGGSVPYKGKHYHEECMDCTNCHISLVGIQFVEDGGQLFCKHCGPQVTYTETERTGGYNPYGESTNPNVPEAKGLGTHDKCPRCNLKVFMNDQIVGPRATMWHRKCLYCEVCRKGLDSSAVIVGNQVYCRDHGRGKK